MGRQTPIDFVIKKLRIKLAKEEKILLYRRTSHSNHR